MSQNKKLTGFLAFVLFIIFLFAGAEWGYRFFLKRKYDKIIALELEDVPCNYRVTPAVHVVYDSKYGERPKPNDTCWFTNVTDGKVIKGTTIFISNADGLDGRTSFKEYQEAEFKILVFGDSYTHWNQQGYTWPDILQDNLNALKGKKVAVLNYARGAFGLLQMLDLAADKIDELKPDMVLFAAGRGNIANSRWWSYEVKDSGYTRWVISSKNGRDKAFWHTNDLAQVTEGTTPQWCERQTANPNPNDPVLKKANAQFLAMNQKRVRQQYHIPLTTWNHSFLWARITGAPQFPSKGFIPQLKVSDFTDDPRCANNIKRIKESKVPAMLLYIPSMEEFKDTRDTIYYNEQKQKLMGSLEKHLGKPFHLLHKEYKNTLPATIDLRPFDMHPNYDGLKFYADAITPMLLVEMSVSGKTIQK